MFKKILALMLVATMSMALVACGDKKSDDENKDVTPTSAPSSSPSATPTPEVKERTDLPEDASSYVNFEDGNADFAVIALSNAACDLASTLSVKDFAGSKGLVATSPASDNIFSGKHPFIAIDVVGMLGEKAADVAKIQYDIGIDFKGGAFQAVAGSLLMYTGEGNVESTTPWSVYLEEQNPKTYTVDVPEGGFVTGAKNYICFTVIDGNPIESTDFDVALDNIVFRDKDGNVITPDTSVKFNTVEGIDQSFWLNLVWDNATKQPVNEKIILTGVKTGSGWWPDAKNSMSFVDGVAKEQGYGAQLTPDDFKPGMVMTIYYDQPFEHLDENAYQIPYLRAQAWATEDGSFAGGSADVWNFTDDYLETDRRNNARTIVQYTYEEIAEALNKGFGTTGEDWKTYCSFLGVADRGAAINIYKVTIGELPE